MPYALCLLDSDSRLLTLCAMRFALCAYPHLEKPQERQTMQPPSCSTEAPQSGQAPISATMWLKPLWQYSPNTLAMASEQLSTISPSCQTGDGHRIPMSCLRMDAGLTPERNANEIRRPVASICELAQPPALPIWAKISQGPKSSLLSVTYSLPQPVFIRWVTP